MGAPLYSENSRNCDDRAGYVFLCTRDSLQDGCSRYLKSQCKSNTISVCVVVKASFLLLLRFSMDTKLHACARFKRY